MDKVNKAFLKWAGGKSSSVDMIVQEVGEVKGRFVEPFVGSAVVSLNVEAKEYLLADFNRDLINLYKVLKEHKDDFIATCAAYFSGDDNTKEQFYKIRALFNESEDIDDRADMFVYLNRHCFNGLCRYNSRGKFNVPFGKYKSVYFPVDEMKFFYRKAEKFEFVKQGFEYTIEQCKPDDVIYCDPPYVPLSDTASFTSYNVDGFNDIKQRILAKLAERSKCLFLISNHDNKITRELYKEADKVITKDVSRFIGAGKGTRKQVKELLAIYNKKS